MFIIVPSILIGISVVGMAVIIYRKMPYLRKLSPDAHEVGDSMFVDFFPELVGWYSSIDLRNYRQATLKELEKGLRRMRLVLLKVDHISERLIKKVRRIHVADNLEKVAEEIEQATGLEQPTIEIPVVDDLKSQEQQLIIEIAQDPKNVELYDKLGDLYIKMESLSDAKEAYEVALGFNPDNHEIAKKYSVLLKRLAVVS